jgi:hypothetical protein
LQSVEALFASAQPVDPELRDAGHTGPELAHLASIYCDSPRAIVFRAPSPDWRQWLIILPLASRLSLMRNPIFASLARRWGLGLRFIGIDRDRLVYDFRALLGDRTLRLLVDLLAACERGALRNEAPWLDVLFDALASQMLTTLERRRSDWMAHLDREHRLEPEASGGLLSHLDRHPDFIARLRQALREHVIDAHFYGRVLRSIDAREAEVDQRVSGWLAEQLDPSVLERLRATPVGAQLGCYNWLRLAPRHVQARAHLLEHMPWVAHYLVETLMPLEAAIQQLAEPVGRGPAIATADLFIRRAIDGGQDRVVIEALAERLAVSPTVIRRLWRESPRALGIPPAWLLPAVLQGLDRSPEHGWPRDDADWQALLEHAGQAALDA